MHDQDDDRNRKLSNRIGQFFLRILSALGRVTQGFDRILNRARQSSIDDGDDVPSESRLNGVWNRIWNLAMWLPRKIGGTIDATERQFSRASQKSGVLGEKITSADNLAFGILKKCLLPLILMGNWIGRIVSPIRGRILESPFVARILPTFKLAAYPLVATSAFCSSFILSRSRPLKLSAAGLALVLILGFFGFRFFGNRSNTIPKAYRAAFEKAIADGDFKYAQIYQQKLLSLGVRASQSQMQAIEELTNSGNLAEAFQLANRLAPLDEPGVPDAHFWLAAQYLKGTDDLSPQDGAIRAEQHLTLLRAGWQRLNPKAKGLPPNVTLLWVYVKFKQDKIEEGLKLLDTIADTHPPATLLRFRSRLKLKLQQEVIDDAARLARMIKQEPEIFDSVDQSFFTDWISALKIFNDRQVLRNVVPIWFQKFPDDPNALQEWATIQLEDIDLLVSRGRKEDLDSALKLLLDTTSRLQSQHQPLITTWFSSRLPPQSSDPNYLELAEKAAEQPLSSLMYEVLGTAAAIRSDNEKALSLLQKATGIDPQNYIAWNNIAQITQANFPNRLELALDAANKAAALAPDNATILYTRGTILAKLSRWEGSIADLVLVIKNNPNLPDAHRTLAIAYRATGQVELAALHETLGNQTN